MHDALRQRLLRRIESLPDPQVYQVLDFIEFLESKYAGTEPVEATGLQRFAESLEDKLRRKAVSPSTIREAFQLISAADRVLSDVSSAGKQILADLNQALEPGEAPGSGAPREGASGSAARGGRPAREDGSRSGGAPAEPARGPRNGAPGGASEPERPRGGGDV